MTLKEALAFRLTNGKTLGETSPEDWLEEYEDSEFQRVELNALDPATMTAEDRQRIRAAIDYRNDFSKALSIVKDHLPKEHQEALSAMKAERPMRG